MPTNLKNKQIFLVVVATKKVWLQYWSVKWVLCKVRRVTRGGRGAGLSCPFSKFKEKCPDFGNNALSRFIYGFNFSFKMLFYVYLGKKSLRCFPVGPSFVCCRLNIYQSAFIFRNLPCPQKFLITCLKVQIFRRQWLTSSHILSGYLLTIIYWMLFAVFTYQNMVIKTYKELLGTCIT